MELSRNLVREFAKIATESSKKTSSETLIYGTAKISDGRTYVKLDGSEVLTPVNLAMEADHDNRVMVSIKNHTATIVGNLTSPAKTGKYIEDTYVTNSKFLVISGDLDDVKNSISEIESAANIAKETAQTAQEEVEAAKSAAAEATKAASEVHDIADKASQDAANAKATADDVAGDASSALAAANAASNRINIWSYDSVYINGGFIAAQTIAANCVVVNDLNAFNAKIGGFYIGDTFLSNNTYKLGVDNNSVYVGLDGISCGQNFIATKDGKVTVKGDIYLDDALYMYHEADAGGIDDKGYYAKALYWSMRSDSYILTSNASLMLMGDLYATYVHVDYGISCVDLTVNGKTIFYDNIAVKNGKGYYINDSTGTGRTAIVMDTSNNYKIAVGGVNNTITIGSPNYTTGMDLYTTGTVEVNGKLKVTGEVTMPSTVHFAGTTASSSTSGYFINSSGGARFNNLYAAGKLNVDGSITTGGLMSSITAYCDSDSAVGGQFTVTGAAHLNGDAYVKRALHYAGSNSTTPTTYLSSSGGIACEVVRPMTTKTYTCGSSSYLWNAVYCKNASNTTSDRNKKRNINYNFDQRYIDMFLDLKVCTYMFDDGDRTHWGMISQDVYDDMLKHGLTDMDFAGFCRDQRFTIELQEDGTEKTIYQFDDDGNPIYDWQLRYGEFIAPCVYMTQQNYLHLTEHDKKIIELEKRITELETKINGVA